MVYADLLQKKHWPRVYKVEWEKPMRLQVLHQVRWVGEREWDRAVAGSCYCDQQRLGSTRASFSVSVAMIVLISIDFVDVKNNTATELYRPGTYDVLSGEYPVNVIFPAR